MTFSWKKLVEIIKFNFCHRRYQQQSTTLFGNFFKSTSVLFFSLCKVFACLHCSKYLGQNITEMEEISDIKRDFNIGKMCRTCLQETEDEMHEIFGSLQQEPDALTLNQVLLQLTGNIQVNKGGERQEVSQSCGRKLPVEFVAVKRRKLSIFLFHFRFSRTTDFLTSCAKNAQKSHSSATTSKSP